RQIGHLVKGFRPAGDNPAAQLAGAHGRLPSGLEPGQQFFGRSIEQATHAEPFHGSDWSRGRRRSASTSLYCNCRRHVKKWAGKAGVRRPSLVAPLPWTWAIRGVFDGPDSPSGRREKDDRITGYINPSV